MLRQKKSIYIILILAFISFKGICQNQKEIDSLKHYLVINKKIDTARALVYNQLGFLYRRSDKDLALLYIDSAVTISNELNYRVGLCGAYNRYGIVHKYKGQYDKAIKFYNKSLVIAKELGEQERIADVYNNLGNVYRMQDNYKQAVESFISALHLREQAADTQGLAAAYNNLSYLYLDQKNYSLAIENNQKSIELFSIVKDSFELARAYSQMGFIHYYINGFDSAVYHCKIALNIFEKLGDKVETATILRNLGNIYAEGGNPSKGIPYLQKALDIQTEMDDSIGIYSSNLSLAQTYMLMNQYNIAEKYLLTAFEIRNRINPIINIYIESSLVAAQIYKAKNDYKQAYIYMVEYNRLKDSLVNENNSRLVTELQEKYDSDKKDLQIEKNELEISNAAIELRQKKLVTITLSILIIIIVLLAYLFYNRYKLKKKQELNEIIIAQKDIRSKAIIDAEERERTRIAKDLHDGIGQQLSAVKLMANSLGNIDNDTLRAQQLNNLKHTLDESIKEVRAISHNMMPNALFKLGLSSAIREFINNISSTGVLKIDLQIIGLKKPLEKTTEVILYRVIQELVNNIIKHANANTLNIQIINHDDTTLNILVEDDGTGFDTSKKEHFDGIGLKNIISRIKYLNGSVEFDSTIGRGTTVIIDVPINDNYTKQLSM